MALLARQPQPPVQLFIGLDDDPVHELDDLSIRRLTRAGLAALAE
jgi:hypothetical protein